MRFGTSFLVSSAVLFASFTLKAAPPNEFSIPVTSWRMVERESGPVNYYTVFPKAAPPYIRGHYRPPMKSSVLGYQLADSDRARAKNLRWRWRAIKLPAGGDECGKGKSDSAAVVYVTWRRTLRWYTLKFVWSANAPKGSVCARKRTPFVAQDVVVLRSGAPLNTWQTESIDLKVAFRVHFSDGDPEANVPDLLGFGLMTDGDQTQSESSADYASFVVTRLP